VISAWFAKERTAQLGTAPPFASIVFVRRPPASGPNTPQDYATYQAGAELVRLAVTVGVDGSLTPAQETNLGAMCGLDPASADIRRPAVSWDGARIAFAARSGPNDPLHVYVIDGTTCAPDGRIDAPPVDDTGSPIALA